MILTCPDCATRYSTKDGAIGANGRTVRCSNCNATWFVSSEPDPLILKDYESDNASDMAIRDLDGLKTPRAATAPALGAHVAMRDMTDQRRRNRRIFGVSMIWGVTFTILAIAAVLGYVFKQDIVNRNPKAATIYKAFGMQVTQSGLDFENAVTRSILIDGNPVLVVNGAVRNHSGASASLPLVELSLLSQSDEKLASWSVDLEKAELASKERIEFATQYPNPPLDAVTLRYNFAGQTAGLSNRQTPVPMTAKAVMLNDPSRWSHY